MKPKKLLSLLLSLALALSLIPHCRFCGGDADLSAGHLQGKSGCEEFRGQ